MLNALALGARELAGLPTPQVPSVSQSFPSKLLPPSLHAKYVRKEDVDPYDNGSQVKALAEGISSLAIEKGQKDAEEKVPEIARERHLTVQGMRKTLKPGAIVELDAPKYGQALSSSIARSAPQTQPKTSFTEVAAEHFLVPLLSQFWAYLRDMLSREEHASRFSSRSRGGYAAAGTGMILSPLVLSHFLNTVAILAHASRHSPAFLSVISPGVLELTVTLGTRKMSTNEDTDSSSRGTSTGATGAASFMEQESKKAASVLRASLELAIVALDGIIDVDGGKVLALEHGPLFANVVAWAEKVFTVVDKGISLEGIGGGEEGRLFRASSGLVLKVEEIKNKWRQSMLIPY
jgi:telomere length regulation protein